MCPLGYILCVFQQLSCALASSADAHVIGLGLVMDSVNHVVLLIDFVAHGGGLCFQIAQNVGHHTAKATITAIDGPKNKDEDIQELKSDGKLHSRTNSCCLLRSQKKHPSVQANEPAVDKPRDQTQLTAIATMQTSYGTPPSVVTALTPNCHPFRPHVHHWLYAVHGHHHHHLSHRQRLARSALAVHQ